MRTIVAYVACFANWILVAAVGLAVAGGLWVTAKDIAKIHRGWGAAVIVQTEPYPVCELDWAGNKLFAAGSIRVWRQPDLVPSQAKYDHSMKPVWRTEDGRVFHGNADAAEAAYQLWLRDQEAE